MTGTKDGAPAPGQQAGGEKTDKPDGAQKAGKPDEALKAGGESDPSKEDLDAAHGRGMAKGIERGQSELLQNLGIDSVDAAQAAIKAGQTAAKEAEKKTRDGETETQKEMRLLKAENAQTIKELREQVQGFLGTGQTIVSESLDIIEADTKKKVFAELKVKDAGTMDAFMGHWPADEGETMNDHVARILKLRPDLAVQEGQERDPKSGHGPAGPKIPNADGDSKAEDRHKAHMKRLFYISGGRDKQLDALPS